MRRASWIFATIGAVLALTPGLPGRARADEVSTAHAPYVHFESTPQNALLLAPSGKTLFVLNTVDHRVEVFRAAPVLGSGLPGAKAAATGASGPAFPGFAPPGGGAAAGVADGRAWRFAGAVFTGLEPVAMALEPAPSGDPQRLFVANRLSDSVSVVDTKLLQVVATLQVGDEPQGLAVAAGRLFVACARAPSSPRAPGQADPGAFDEHAVVVASATAPYAWIANVVVPAFRPRDVLAIGSKVYVLPENSGNHTTLLDENQTKAQGLEQWVLDAQDVGTPFNPVLLRPELNPLAFARGWYVPNAGRIVFDHEQPGTVLQLADQDLIAIDAGSLAVLPGAVQGVGTSLFDAELNPVTGDVWIANTDARNRVRFEPNLRGKAIENRVTIAVPGGAVKSTIVLEPPQTPEPFAQPVVIAFDGVRRRAYVACLGSAAVVVLDAVTGAFVDAIPVGPLPCGLAFDAANGRLIVFCRGDGTIRTFDATRRHAGVGEPARLSYDPEPPVVKAGRLHLYDARPADGRGNGHGNGTMSCASCHLSAHGDQLAWDLGDPGGSFAYYFPDVLDDFGSYPGQIVAAPTTPILHPLKGPMVTQSLRGPLDESATDDLPLHWRGDRRTLQAFRPAFRSLLGGAGVDPLAMQELTEFVRSVRVPPNPLEPRDRAYVGAAAAGKDLAGHTARIAGKPYSGAGVACAKCHQADLAGQANFTAARPVASAGSFSQLFQTASFRQAYEKDDRELTGFGLLHDGAVDGIRGFLDFVVPNGGAPTFPNFTVADKDAVAAFVRAFDSGIAPLVGAQFTLDAASLAQADAFFDLAEGHAKGAAPDADLIVKGFRLAPGGQILPRGGRFVLQPALGNYGYVFDAGTFADRALLKAVAAAGIATFTFTCVPPGMGERLGVDRDEDGVPDAQETAAGIDPARADTDGDGYDDGVELALGSDPRAPNAALPDGVAPQWQQAVALDVFHDAATLRCVLSEPAGIEVLLGSQPGLADLGTMKEGALRRRHDLNVTDLPAKTTVHVRLIARDRNQNAALHDLTLRTMPPFLHVAQVRLDKTGATSTQLEARVKVVDAKGQPVDDAPVLGFFSGDIGGQAWQRIARTAADGVATFPLAPFVPAAPGTVGFAPVFVGSLNPSDPFFVGKGGDAEPAFYYEQAANDENFATISVP